MSHVMSHVMDAVRYMMAPWWLILPLTVFNVDASDWAGGFLL